MKTSNYHEWRATMALRYKDGVLQQYWESFPQPERGIPGLWIPVREGGFHPDQVSQAIAEYKPE